MRSDCPSRWGSKKHFGRRTEGGVADGRKAGVDEDELKCLIRQVVNATVDYHVSLRPVLALSGHLW